MAELGLTPPDGARMRQLLALRQRLHVEIGAGIRFRGPSPASLIRGLGISAAPRRIHVLRDLNAYVIRCGGPHDERYEALAAQYDPVEEP